MGGKGNDEHWDVVLKHFAVSNVNMLDVEDLRVGNKALFNELAHGRPKDVKGL